MRVNQIPHVRLNNYQLDKRKKQWALLSATVLTALSAGLASAHAADQPTAVLTAPHDGGCTDTSSIISRYVHEKPTGS